MHGGMTIPEHRQDIEAHFERSFSVALLNEPKSLESHT